jgi:hypothetical protein
MGVISRNVFSAAAVCLCAAVMLATSGTRPALAQDEHQRDHQTDHGEARVIPARLVNAAMPVPAVHAHPVSRLAGRYFVDFRSRTAATYGHAFVWYGRLNAHGKIGLVDVAGLHPASENPIPYIIGHIFPVPSETGKSYGDLDEEYLTANYRVYLSEADARKVFAYIKYKQETSPLWLASVYNCTAFISDIAAYMGLKTPVTGTWMYPEDFVNSLRDLNNGREEISLAAANNGLSDAAVSFFGALGQATR